MKSKNILVIGGAGYIGSHMVRLLLENNYSPIVFDNLSTGYKEFIPSNVAFEKGDLKNLADIETVFKKHQIDSVIHFAAFSLVGESVSNPLKYYDNNVLACINLLKVMTAHKVNNFILSSTAATYGEPKEVPITEEAETIPTNPYGRSKLMIETMLKDIAAISDLRFISLRYFNAAGAHPGGGIGEKHNPETHLIPNIFKSISGEKPEITIFGDDYPTADGTCIRDYIHVVDLCNAHLLSLNYLNQHRENNIFNLGSGEGYSVKEVLKMTETVTGKKAPVSIGPKRAGDPARLIAGSSKAQKILNWKIQFSLKDIIQTAWNFEQSLK